MPGKTSRRYVFVAIDRTMRRVFMHIYGDMTDKSSVDFLRRLKLASPIKMALLHKSIERVVPQTPDGFTAWSPLRSWACPSA